MSIWVENLFNEIEQSYRKYEPFKKSLDLDAKTDKEITEMMNKLKGEKVKNNTIAYIDESQPSKDKLVKLKKIVDKSFPNKIYRI